MLNGITKMCPAISLTFWPRSYRRETDIQTIFPVLTYSDFAAICKLTKRSWTKTLCAFCHYTFSSCIFLRLPTRVSLTPTWKSFGRRVRLPILSSTWAKSASTRIVPTNLWLSMATWSSPDTWYNLPMSEPRKTSKRSVLLCVVTMWNEADGLLPRRNISESH